MTNERNHIISILNAALDTLRATLPANIEVVVHDLTQPATSILSIVNSQVSGRKAGDGILHGPDDDAALIGLLRNPQCLPVITFRDYKTMTSSGTPLSSASTIYYDTNGKPLVGFCVNVDFTAVNRLKSDLDYLTIPAQPDDTYSLPGGLSEQSLEDVLLQYRPTGSENKMEFRMRVVSEIHTMGFFKIKGSVNHVAKALGVTRFTIYNYLEKLNAK